MQLDRLKDPVPIPTEKEFSCVIESSLPVVVQFSRINPDRMEKSFLSTIAFASD
ncbi:MAG: hypothetical protein HC906_13820 [Bacteroidales bacterium]|nr:hypothetical protein [Bacteroidales bacterium]